MKAITITGVFALILSFASTGLSAPLTERDVTAGPDAEDLSTCSNPIVRKEWRTLTTAEKKKYIKAVKCLQDRPAITTLNAPGAVSRFDDFQASHILQTNYIHYVGQFLPWHRYFVWIYEKALREECGWEGGQPYWDWTLDKDNWEGSPMFNPETGFGGNGEYIECPALNGTCIPGGTGGGCIQSGPFKDTVVHLGPMDNLERNDRCLTRDFHPQFAAEYFSQSAMDATMNQQDFEGFRQSLEGLFLDLENMGQHGSGHLATGGAMTDVFASPADPLFFFHHGQLDRLWWIWQKKQLSRLWEISGPTVAQNQPGNPGPNITLNYELSVGLIGPTIKVKKVMNIWGKLCYRYE